MKRAGDEHLVQRERWRATPWLLLMSFIPLIAVGCGDGGGGGSGSGSTPTPAATTPGFPTPSPESTPTPEPTPPEPTETPVPAECLAPDPPLAFAVAERITATTASGVILQLDLGDLAWQPIAELPGFDPGGGTFGSHSLDFTDCERGWVAGDTASSTAGKVLRTDDGGRTWVDQTQNINLLGLEGSLELRGVDFFTRDRGVLTGNRILSRLPSVPTETPPLVLLTSDGGETWTPATILPAPEGMVGGNLRNATLFAVCLTRSGIGVASGTGFSGDLQIMTTDGGATWQDVTDQIGGSTICVGEMDLWNLFGEILRHSPDGGRTWIDKTENLPGSVRGADLGVPTFIDTATGWMTARRASGEVLVLHTTDTGGSWVELSSLPEVADTSFRRGIHFSTASFGIVNGARSDGDTPGFAAAAVTQDGGITWEVSSFEPSIRLVADLALVP